MPSEFGDQNIFQLVLYLTLKTNINITCLPCQLLLHIIYLTQGHFKNVFGDVCQSLILLALIREVLIRRKKKQFEKFKATIIVLAFPLP